MFADHHPKFHYASMKNAWAGIYAALQSQRNFRLEVLLGTFAILAALFLEFTTTKMIIVFGTVFLVLTFELINTAIEEVLDFIHPEEHPKIKLAKDLSAGAMLMVVILSVLVGLYLFLPVIVDRFF